MSEAEFVAVVRADAVDSGKAVAVTIDGRSVLVCNYQGRFFAIDNKCSHAEEPLECGRIRNGWIACPAHGARFDLESGEALNPPAIDPVRTYPVRLSGDTVEVAMQ
jgi:3-phenylpropionate/trans-cinnamate dioxygenase ferredoxin subunit